LGHGLRPGGTAALAVATAHPGRAGKLMLTDVAPGFPEARRQAFRVITRAACQTLIDADLVHDLPPR